LRAAREKAAHDTCIRHPASPGHRRPARRGAVTRGRALLAFAGAGVTLLNRSLQLRGVNHPIEALAELCEPLFEVTEARGQALLAAAAAPLPGGLVPRRAGAAAGAPATSIVPPASR
jgi:hypothetical protein